METLVVNKITLTVPADQVLVDVAREVPPVLRNLEGFIHFTVAQTGPQEIVVVIRWASPEAAQQGAAVIGPGAFNTWIAPRASAQDRVVGPIVITEGAGG